MNKNDETILALQRKVEEKKSGIARAARPQWKTNLAFKINGGVKNLNTVLTISECVYLLASLVKDKNAFEEAAQILGVKNQFEYDGFSYADWVDDLKTRASIISINEQKQSLKKLEDALASLESSELKTQKTLLEIAAALD